MATYLIDYENVHQNGLNGIEKLTEADSLIIFVGNTTNEVPVETVTAMLRTPAQIQLKKLKRTAKDYLDFQLATCIGGLVERGEDKNFCIISNDRGFKAVIDYWQTNKPSVTIELRNVISLDSASKEEVSSAPSAAPAKKLDAATKKTIRGLVKAENLSPANHTSIYNLFLNENQKQTLHTGLVRLFEQKKGTRLYKLLRDVFDQYKAD